MHRNPVSTNQKIKLASNFQSLRQDSSTAQGHLGDGLGSERYLYNVHTPRVDTSDD